MLTLILQTVSGAINAEDALVQRIRMGADAAAHVTTQGATMVYRAPPEARATDMMELELEDRSLLEYMPEPRILFPDSSLSQRLLIRMAASATAVVSDAFVLHDPASLGRCFRHYEAEVVVQRPAGRVVVVDRLDLDRMPRAQGRRARFTAYGTLLILAALSGPELETLARSIEARIGVSDEIYTAASTLPQEVGIGLRIAATDGRHLRTALAAGWHAARRHLFGCDPSPRRKIAG